jgi:hypothetical protein
VLWQDQVQLLEADTGLNRYPLMLDIYGNNAIELVEVDQGVVGDQECPAPNVRTVPPASLASRTISMTSSSLSGR